MRWPLLRQISIAAQRATKLPRHETHLNYQFVPIPWTQTPIMTSMNYNSIIEILFELIKLYNVHHSIFSLAISVNNFEEIRKIIDLRESFMKFKQTIY